MRFFLEAINGLGCDPNHTIMIGDVSVALILKADLKDSSYIQIGIVSNNTMIDGSVS